MAGSRANDVAPALAAAATAIEEGRWAEAADLLLAAWRDCRDERIARALAGVDLRLPPPAPLDGKLVRTREAQWHELVQLGDEESLRRALGAPWPTHPREARARVEALGALTSARISNALLAVHRGSQYTSNTGVRLSREIFRQLIEKDDHAVVTELERLAMQPNEAHRLGPALLRRKRPEAPYLSPAGEAALAQIEQLLVVQERADGPTRDNLLAAIYDAPHDDAPRLVYADVLSEASDPRGEFITLQLQGGDRRRVDKLLKAGGRQWLDGLDADGATKIIHARGFPAIATLAGGEVRAPAWATIEKLYLAKQCEFAGGMQLRALRELYDLGAKELATAKLPSYELDVLTMREYPESLGVDTPFAPRILGLGAPHSFPYYANATRTLLGEPLARRLEIVRLGISLRQLPATIALANETDLTIELCGGYDLDREYQWAARVTAKTLRLHWAGTGPYGDIAFESVFPILQALPSPQFQDVEITGEAPGHERVRDALVRIIETWPRVRTAQILGVDSSVTN
ncbi:MAG: TIGR02996 domain-containing protein [Myxococcota bacterium]|nr:TIGR02996 domain-containing protein [Myxococcota bacterium]